MKTARKDRGECRPTARTRTNRLSRRHFLMVAGAAGIGALPFIYGCKEKDMNIFSTTSETLAAAEAAPAVIPPIDRAVPAETAAATFGMG
jgi:hypothetical protein